MSLQPAVLFQRLKAQVTRHRDRFLGRVSGVIHVGANTGQERNTYRKFGLRVAWVEPIPEVFAELQANLVGYAGQQAYQSLVTDQEGADYTFKVASNGGASSSILDFQMHKDIWPQVGYEREIMLKGTTLTNLVRRAGIELKDFQALIMDTQGSELLVLKGAEEILSSFRFIKIEVPDFAAYKNCCQLEEVEEYLGARGYREYSRQQFARHASGGSYYNLVYQRLH